MPDYAPIESPTRSSDPSTRVTNPAWLSWLKRLVDNRSIFGTAPNYSEFEADGTLVAKGAATTWEDINFRIIIKTIGAGTPAENTFQGNLTMPQWAVNDAQQVNSEEMVHAWKEGSQTTWHIHFYTGGSDVTDRYVKFSVEFTWANVMTTVPVNITLDSPDILIPANTPIRTHLIADIGTWTPVGGHIAAHVKPRLKRIAAAGTAPTANVFCDLFQLHIERDTQGSRQIITK